jgi:hypothetical protein
LGLLEIHLRTLIMTGPFTAAVIALLLFGIRYEALGLVDQFRKEAASGSGTILMQEVPVLASPWQRLKQRLRALQRGGLRAYFQVARLQSAQLDLAMERWHRQLQRPDLAGIQPFRSKWSYPKTIDTAILVDVVG